MFLDVVVVVEFENVHGEHHSDEVAKGLCAYGGHRAVGRGCQPFCFSVACIRTILLIRSNRIRFLCFFPSALSKV